MLPAVRKVGKNKYTLLQESNNALLCSFGKFHSRRESTKVLDES